MTRTPYHIRRNDGFIVSRWETREEAEAALVAVQAEYPDLVFTVVELL